MLVCESCDIRDNLTDETACARQTPQLGLATCPTEMSQLWAALIRLVMVTFQHFRLVIVLVGIRVVKEGV